MNYKYIKILLYIGYLLEKYVYIWLFFRKYFTELKKKENLQKKPADAHGPLSRAVLFWLTLYIYIYIIIIKCAKM